MVQPDRQLLNLYLAHLPESGAWTQAERDRWMAAFTAAVDMTIRVEGNTETRYIPIGSLPPGMSRVPVGESFIRADAQAAQRFSFSIDDSDFAIPPHAPNQPYRLAGSALCEMAEAPELWKVVTFDNAESGPSDSLIYVEPGATLEVVAGDRFTTKGPGTQ